MKTAREMANEIVAELCDAGIIPSENDGHIMLEEVCQKRQKNREQAIDMIEKQIQSGICGNET